MLPSEPDLPQVICESCVHATVNSYLFKTLCKYSNEKWIKTLDVFEQSLYETTTLSPRTQSAFIVLKKDEYLIFTSRKSNTTKSKSAAVMKMKHLRSNRTKEECGLRRTSLKDIDKQKNKSKRTKYLNKVQNIICEQCGIRRTSLKGLIKHMEIHSKMSGKIDKQMSEKRQISCPQCIKLFSTKYQLTIHIERMHTAKKFKCSKCTKMFSAVRLLKAHEKNNHIAKKCKLCFIEFPSKVALRRHMDRHGDNKCLKCNKAFNNRITCKRHIKKCGDPNSKNFNFFCDICNKGYVGKNGLQSHFRIDHGFGRVLACKWCGKKYDAASKLKSHIVKHTRERNFYCEHCGGKFVTQAALRCHIRLHTGERPFPCDLCKETFLSASRRMEHKRRKHFGPTKECNICHIKFTTSHELKKHIKRHSNPHSKLYVPVFDKKITTVEEENE